MGATYETRFRALADAEGWPYRRFEFPNVTPGQYLIQVDRGRRNSSTEGEFGVLPVAVDGADVTGLVLQTSAGSSITGRVRFDMFLGAKAPRSRVYLRGRHPRPATLGSGR